MPIIAARDGAKLNVKIWGEGPPVFLIHGWPLSADTWDPVGLALAEAGFRAIAYDRRGFGRSEQPWEGYDYDTLTDDLSAVMAPAAARDAALVGFSMGGGEVARYMTRRGGEGVTRAALISSVVPLLARRDDNPKGVPAATLDQMTASMRADRAHFMRGFVKEFFGVGALSRPVSGEVLDWAWSLCMQAGLHATLACAEAFAQTDFRPALPAFRVPTLIVHGTKDETVPIDPTGRAAAAGIGGAEFHEYDGAPHGLFATHQDRLIADLLDFLRR